MKEIPNMPLLLTNLSRNVNRAFFANETFEIKSYVDTSKIEIIISFLKDITLGNPELNWWYHLDANKRESLLKYSSGNPMEIFSVIVGDSYQEVYELCVTKAQSLLETRRTIENLYEEHGKLF